jgi:hypothetical protein
MEIRKTNMEIRKNWNKFTFKKLGAILCLFLFGVVAFTSGNLTQVNAASSSTVLPVTKGGTGANSASQALINLGKVNSINANSTDDQFPSAKSVYDSTDKVYSTVFPVNTEDFNNPLANNPGNGSYAYLLRAGHIVSLSVNITSKKALTSSNELYLKKTTQTMPSGYKISAAYRHSTPISTLCSTRKNKGSAYLMSNSENFFVYTTEINTIAADFRLACTVTWITDDPFPTS